MPAQVIEGRQLADRTLTELKGQIQKDQLQSKLVSIVIGGDRLSHKFVDLKAEAAASIGVAFEKKSFPDDFDAGMILDFIREKNSDNQIHGIVIQLPVPKTYHQHQLLKAIHPFKDVDCLHPKNLGLLLEGHAAVLPPVVLAVLEVIRSTGKFGERSYSYHNGKTTITIPDLTGVHITLVGTGILVGKPLAAFLINQNATVSLVNEYTRDPSSLTRTSPIVITGTNQANVLQPDNVADGTILIDVGRDLETDRFLTKDIFFCKNPGGIGPLTVAYLLQNTILVARNK